MKRIALTLTLLLVAGEASGDITSNLVAWCKFDDGTGTTAADSSGNGNNLTFAASGAAPGWGTGQIGGCLTVDGGDRAEKTSPSGLPTGDGHWTIACWVRPTNLSGIDYWVWKGAEDETASRLLSVGTSGSSVRVAHWSDDVVYASATITLNTWQHVAVTYDGTTERVYINGSLVDSVSQGPFNLSSGTLTIGNRTNATGNGTVGSLDEVRIYTRALSSDDVAELHAYTGSGGSIIPILQFYLNRMGVLYRAPGGRIVALPSLDRMPCSLGVR